MGSKQEKTRLVDLLKVWVEVQAKDPNSEVNRLLGEPIAIATQIFNLLSGKKKKVEAE